MQQLPHDAIIACTCGYRQAIQTELGLELRRYSAAELAYYAYSEAALARALCTAGVALSFTTTSDRLDISLRLGTGARAYAYVDCYVDGCFIGTAGSETSSVTLDAAFRWLASSTHQVTLYLPHCRQAGIQSLALADGADAAPVARPVLLALGDSITQGMESRHPSLTWPAVAARALGLNVHGCGNGGHYYDAAGLIDRPVDAPALIIVAYGTNDWNLERAADHARPYLARVRELYPTTPLAILEPPWWEGGETEVKGGVTMSQYRTALAAIAAEFAVDAYLPMPALLPPGPCFLADSVHPSTAGHLVMGANVAAGVAGLVGVTP